MNVTAFARKILDAAPRPLPRYGSPEWELLEETDPQRLAAVIVAAECWRDHCSAERVAVELDRRRQEDEALYLETARRLANDVHEAIPRIEPDSPWWARVFDAERECRREAALRFQQWEREHPGGHR